MKLNKKQMVEQCYLAIRSRLGELKQRTYEDLLPLLPESEGDVDVYTDLEELKIGKYTYSMAEWAQLEEDQSLAVMVEARRPIFLGAQVLAEGFFISRENQITQMKESDLWEHGY